LSFEENKNKAQIKFGAKRAIDERVASAPGTLVEPKLLSDLSTSFVRSVHHFICIESETMSARTDEEAEQVQASSGITPESLSKTLRSKLEAEHVDISDLSGTVPNQRFTG
jgi:hypothetical protein